MALTTTHGHDSSKRRRRWPTGAVMAKKRRMAEPRLLAVTATGSPLLRHEPLPEVLQTKESQWVSAK